MSGTPPGATSGGRDEGRPCRGRDRRRREHPHLRDRGHPRRAAGGRDPRPRAGGGHREHPGWHPGPHRPVHGRPGPGARRAPGARAGAGRRRRRATAAPDRLIKEPLPPTPAPSGGSPRACEAGGGRGPSPCTGAAGTGQELVDLVGLHGSGKSTWVREHLAATHAVVSKDHWPNARRREARQRRVVAELLAEGRSVVVDNTNPSAAERAPLVAAARVAGVPVRCVWVDTPWETCLERNEARDGRAKVPLVGVLATRGRFERPTREEGFD